MSYIDRQYYKETFGGKEIPEEEFDRIADIASDVIYDVCYRKPTDEETCSLPFKKAVCYQAEMLYEQGGVDAILGFSEAAQRGGSEHLGDYSVSAGTTHQEAVLTSGGVPISALAIMNLRRLGLMSRWVYAGRHERREQHGE